MKQSLILALISSLFFGCKSTSSIETVQAHYEKYCVQLIEVKIPRDVNKPTASDFTFNSQKILSRPDTKITPYPLVYLKMGEEITDDSQTTPLEIAESISDSPDGPVVKENARAIVKLGKQITAKLSKAPRNDFYTIYLKFQERIYLGLDDYITTSSPSGSTMHTMPLFALRGIETSLTTALNTWELLGGNSDETFHYYYLVRMTAPDASIVPSIVEKMVIRK